MLKAFCKISYRLKAIDQFRKTLHHRCLTDVEEASGLFWICPCITKAYLSLILLMKEYLICLVYITDITFSEVVFQGYWKGSCHVCFLRRFYEINPNFALNASSDSGKMASTSFKAIETSGNSCSLAFTTVRLTGCQWQITQENICNVIIFITFH